MRGGRGTGRRWVAAAALAAALWAAPAWAAVQDPGNLSPPDVDRIATGLAGLKADDEFEVILQAGAPPDGLDAEARRQFDARGLAPRQACFVVDLPGKAIGVALGQSFVDEGVTGESLRNRVEVAFSRPAAEGRVGEGVVELARQLKVMRATGAAAPYQLPVGLLTAAVLGAGGLLGFRRWRATGDRRDALRARFASARQAAGRTGQGRSLLAQAVGQRGRSGASAGLAARLLRLGDGAAQAASEVAGLLTQAESALAGGNEADAERGALQAECRAFQAEAALAAARTAAAELELGAEALRARVAAAVAGGEVPAPPSPATGAAEDGLAPALTGRDRPEASAATATPSFAALSEARAAAEAGDAAACLAALARAGAVPRSPADGVADAEACARDWLALRAAQALQAATPGAGAVSSQVLLRRLHELRLALTAVPVKLDEAEAGLAQLLAQLGQVRPAIRVQRVATSDQAPDPEGLWDLTAARWVATSGTGGEPPAPHPRGPRGRAM